MAEDWNAEEIVIATRAYMWMRRSQNEGFTLKKSRVNEALIAGPLHKRGRLDYRFSNISAVLKGMNMTWAEGFNPQENVGATNTAIIGEAVEAYLNGPKSAKRVSALVQALSPEIVRKAAVNLANGATFDFPDSTTYDVDMGGGVRLAPKRVIGYAALLHYGAPLLPVDFAGGLGSFAFGRLEAAGLTPARKGAEEEFEELEEEEFEDAVKELKERGFKTPPAGKKKPLQKKTVSYSFQRDPRVVAYVEIRAGGVCELCGTNAPFIRANGEKFLEVHHVEPLSEGGEDTVKNAAGLCPNCHRECHHGARASEIRKTLIQTLSTF